jgi:hypothetical protein
MLKRDIILTLILICLFFFSGIALAKKKPDTPSSVIDYDIVGFECPAYVMAGDPIEVTVWIVNRSSTDPGALLRIYEDDALLGDTLNVSETVYDDVDTARPQSTAYSYEVTPTYQQTYITWEAFITDEQYVDDLDWDYCHTTLLWD